MENSENSPNFYMGIRLSTLAAHIEQHGSKSASCWQGVAMVSPTYATVEDLREYMEHLDDAAVESGYKHYLDLWTWDNNSERTRRLMLAFEEEHKAPKDDRIYNQVRHIIEMTESLDIIRNGFASDLN